MLLRGDVKFLDLWMILGEERGRVEELSSTTIFHPLMANGYIIGWFLFWTHVQTIWSYEKTLLKFIVCKKILLYMFFFEKCNTSSQEKMEKLSYKEVE